MTDSILHNRSAVKHPSAIDPLLLQLDHRQFFLPGFQRPYQELAELTDHLIHVVRLDGPLAGKEIGQPQLPHSELFQGSDEQRHRVRIPAEAYFPRSPNKRPCAYPGCHAWARRDSDESLCAAHAHTAAKELLPRPKRTPPGAPPASPPRTHGGQPGNQNRLVHGFYSRTLHPEDVADLDEGAQATDLDAEILITRVAKPTPSCRPRAVAMLHSGTDLGNHRRPLSAEELLRLIGLAFQGARTVGRLLDIKQSLGAGDSLFTEAINDALDELSAEWGIEL